jgi:hypothetical protein
MKYVTLTDQFPIREGGEKGVWGGKEHCTEHLKVILDKSGRLVDACTISCTNQGIVCTEKITFMLWKISMAGIHLIHRSPS